MDRADATSASERSSSESSNDLSLVQLTRFKSDAQSTLARLLPDHGEHLDRADLARLIADPSVKGQDAITVAALYEISVHPLGHSNNTISPAWAINSVTDIVGVPVSDADNWAMVQKYKSSTSADERAKIMAQGDIENGAAFFQDQLTRRLSVTTTRALYADSKNPLSNIKMDDVHQGDAGDCYFEAALADAARQNPALIAEAISTNANGTYTVTFKGDRQNPVTVTAPTDAELALYNGGSADGLWPAVMEKAFAKYATDVLKRPVSDLASIDATAGGDATGVIALLTGNFAVEQTNFVGPGRTSGVNAPADNYSADAEQNAALFFADALSKGHLAVVGTDNSVVPQQTGLQSNHAYSVIGFRPGKNGGQVTLRNPWGASSRSGNETIELTMDQLFAGPVTVSAEMGNT